MTKKQLLVQLKKMRVHQKDGKKAAHKPLLLLRTIGQWNHGHRQAQNFKTIKLSLEKLLHRFALKDSYKNVHEPFIRLESSLWIVRDSNGNIIDRTSEEARKKLAKQLFNEPHLYTGELSPQVTELFQKDDTALDDAVRDLLDEYLPPTHHEDICFDVDLQDVILYKRPPRDPSFRRKVMSAYLSRCAMCNYGVTIHNDTAEQSNVVVGLEASHIKPYCYGGRDRVSNALALCSIHHKALGYGAISVDEQYKILVSSHIKNYKRVGQLLFIKLAGDKIYLPQDHYDRPSQQYLKWHRNAVFHR